MDFHRIEAKTRQTRAVVAYAIGHTGPVYIRMDSGPLPVLHGASYRFAPGLPDVLAKGRDAVVFCLGTLAHEALAVRDHGFDPSVVSLPSLWPLDELAALELVRPRRRVITLEGHGLSGGLGTIISELLLQYHLTQPLRTLGISPYEFAHGSSRATLRRQLSIDAAGLTAALSQQTALSPLETHDER